MQKADFNEETAAKTQLIYVDVRLNPADVHVELMEIKKTAAKLVDLIGADIVVSVGRGIGKDPQLGIQLATKLAESLGGVVGSSRAVVDAGWLTAEHQVGQTGKTVHPIIYIALGISGAIQHRAGMQGAETIIAVNKNADAPIFEAAHYGIAGDLFAVTPLLTDAIRELRNNR
jgi:electron transfer flavoprotein alpha subunit